MLLPTVNWNPESNNFPILDEIRKIDYETGSVTLSVGAAKGGSSEPAKQGELAQQA